MPTLDDICEGSTDRSKQKLQQALLELLRGNPDIFDSVTKSIKSEMQQDKKEVAARCANEQDAQIQRSSSVSHPELENHLNQSQRPRYQWQLSDSDDGIDSAWTTATKHMSPNELSKWRRGLYSVYAGHLPHDITKKELVQLFGEAGNVQDVHLQPSNRGSHTYGFIRYCTLNECRDAIAMLHGRLLGNITITVEYASETKERLSCDESEDLPQGKKDRLLKGDFPRVEQYHSMSKVESQEKMVLWKLRCSARRQKSSSTGNVMATQEGDKEEALINALQEIVKKVSSLPNNTLAQPSGSEGTPCSPWITKEINGCDENHMSNQQSVATHSTGEGLQRRRIFEDNVNDGTNSQSIELLNRREILQQPTSQRIPRRPCEADALHLRNSSVSPSPLKRYESAGSPDMIASLGGYFSPSSPDEAPSPGRYTSPISQDDTPSPTAYTSPSSPDATPSPRRGGASFSEVETSDPFNHNSPERFLRQDCKNCHEEISTGIGHESNSTQMRSTTSFCHPSVSTMNSKGLCSFESDRNYNEQGLQTSGESPVSCKVPHQATKNGEVAQDFKGVSPQHNQIHDTFAQKRKETDSATTKTHPMQRLQGDRPPEVEKNSYPASVKLRSSNSAMVPPSAVPASLSNGPVSPSDSSTVSARVPPQVSPGRGWDPPTGAASSRLPEPVSSSDSSAVRPLLEQQLFTNPFQRPHERHTPGQPQHIQPMPVSMASRFQHPGFPRQQLGNPPFLPPGVLHPGMFPGWNANAFLQQQLLASRLQFGLPFYAGMRGIQPNSGVPLPFQGLRTPLGRFNRGASGRGRSFAPRFPNAGLGSTRTHGEFGRSKVPWTTNLEETSSLKTTSDTPKDRTYNSSQNQETKLESESSDSLPPLKSTPNTSCNKIGEKTSETQSPGGSNSSPNGCSCDGLAKESEEDTECRRFTHGRQETGDQGRFNAKGLNQVTFSNSALENAENEVENTEVKSNSPHKMTQSEMRLNYLKNELKKISRENETMRRNIDWTKSSGMAGNRDKESQLKKEINGKELFIQKEREIFVLRNQEQELLFEREKLEAAFDQHLKKQLETEQKIGETENRIHLAKLENELLRLYQNLYGYNTVLY